MIVNILHYDSNSVEIIKAPDSVYDENVEDFLSNVLHYRLDDISYMCSDAIDLTINTY